jgi:hypothetical protein
VPYELDGGERKKARKLRINVHPASVRICVPPREVTRPRHACPLAGGSSLPLVSMTKAAAGDRVLKGWRARHRGDRGGATRIWGAGWRASRRAQAPPRHGPKAPGCSRRSSNPASLIAARQTACR